MCDNNTRQYDILWARGDWFSIPPELPGRLNGDDFVMFKWPCDFPKCNYTVVIQSLDTAGPPFRSIGKLDHQLRLPFVQLGYGNDIKIGVIPESECDPSFWAKLVRGSTYDIPNKKCSGVYMMQRYGMDRPN